MLTSDNLPTTARQAPAETFDRLNPPDIFVVDDDSELRERIREILVETGWPVEEYSTYQAFLEDFHTHRLNDARRGQCAIVIARASEVSMVVHVLRAGISDFIAKPVERDELLVSVERALKLSWSSYKPPISPNRIGGLTERQLQILELVLAGHPSKNIAADLGISQRTVEKHRASIKKRTGMKSLPDLTRLAFARAPLSVADEPSS